MLPLSATVISAAATNAAKLPVHCWTSAVGWDPQLSCQKHPDLPHTSTDGVSCRPGKRQASHEACISPPPPQARKEKSTPRPDTVLMNRAGQRQQRLQYTSKNRPRVRHIHTSLIQKGHGWHRRICLAPRMVNLFTSATSPPAMAGSRVAGLGAQLRKSKPPGMAAFC